MTEKIIDVTNLSSLQGKKAVLLFWAPWHEASAPGGLMHQVLGALATTTSSSSSSNDNDDNTNAILFGRVQAEECTAISQYFHVTVVPTFVLLNAAGVVVHRIEGGGGDNVPAVTQAVQQLMRSSSSSSSSSSSGSSSGQVESAAAVTQQQQQQETLTQKLDRLIASSPVMLFMKGTPDAPRCGFSRQAVALLQDENIAFGSFDILSDETVRQGLKTHSNWPTYPQIYVKSELIGGLDILKEMKESGESLKSQLGLTDEDAAAAAAPLSLHDRLGQLIHKSPVMLFMKGLPSAPRCGFSRQMVELLEAEHIPFDSFDILQDEQVRQGLKTYSNWPTYPQLYVKGELIGGLDIVKEMKEEGSSLKEALGLE